MSFLGMGPLEILVILVLAFLILGPAKLPETVRSVGKGIRALRKASLDMTAEFTRAMDEAEQKEPQAPEETPEAAGEAGSSQKP